MGTGSGWWARRKLSVMVLVGAAIAGCGGGPEAGGPLLSEALDTMAAQQADQTPAPADPGPSTTPAADGPVPGPVPAGHQGVRAHVHRDAPGRPPIAGVTISADDGTTVVTDETDADGEVFFDTPAGRVLVAIDTDTLPEGLGARVTQRETLVLEGRVGNALFILAEPAPSWQVDLTTGDGWEYRIDITIPTTVSVRKELDESPPGLAQMVVTVGGGPPEFVATGTLPGRNAPALGIRNLPGTFVAAWDVPPIVNDTDMRGDDGDSGCQVSGRGWTCDLMRQGAGRTGDYPEEAVDLIIDAVRGAAPRQYEINTAGGGVCNLTLFPGGGTSLSGDCT